MADQIPNIFPAMRFADPGAALEWLSQAFGFTQRAVHRDEEGVVRHAEMSLGAGTIMFGHGDPRSPTECRDTRRRWTEGARRVEHEQEDHQRPQSVLAGAITAQRTGAAATCGPHTRATATPTTAPTIWNVQ